jgi:hypothetical protein
VSDPSDRIPPDASVNVGPLDARVDAASLDASTDAARDAAGPLLGTCGEPQYRCPPSCHGQLTLRGGTRQQQPCVDDCRFELTILPQSPGSDGPCTPPLAQLSIQDIANDYRDRSATLSDEAWSELGRLSEYLDTQRLWPTPCANCTNVRSGSITVPGIDQFESDISYRSDAVPAWLSEADAFVQALIDQLTVCEGPLIRDCKDTTPAPGPDEPLPTPPSCNFVYSNQQLTAVSCTMPIDQSAPCRAAVACMCGSGLLEPGRQDPAFCEESWLTPRGAITFSDFCGNGAAQATRTLSEALQLFAAAYQDQVVVQPECGQMSAYY